MTEPMKISPEAQQLFMQMQTHQHQLQGITMQKENMTIQKAEWKGRCFKSSRSYSNQINKTKSWKRS